MFRSCFVLATLLLLAPAPMAQRARASNDTLTDVFWDLIPVERFEGQMVGAFPSTAWQDIRALTRPKNQPDPSCTIIATTGPKGRPTQALQFANAISSSCGLYMGIAPTRQYRIHARVRIDRWSGATVLRDWPIAFGPFTRPGPVRDFNNGPQVIIYVSSRDRDWRFYSFKSDGGQTQFVSFGAPAELDVWYSALLQFDENTGVALVRIRNAETGALLVNQTVAIPNWSLNSGGFKNVGIFDGAYFSDASVGGQATIDNLSFVPSF